MALKDRKRVLFSCKALFVVFFVLSQASQAYANFEELMIATEGMKQRGKADTYAEHIAQSSTDLNTASRAVTAVTSFVDGNRAIVYTAYVKRQDADESVILKILKITASFEHEWDKETVYTAYMKREDANEELIAGILEIAATFHEWNNANVYEAYITCQTIDEQELIRILEIALHYAALEYALKVYTPYISHKNAQQKYIHQIIDTLMDSYVANYSIFKLYLTSQHTTKEHIESLLSDISSFRNTIKPGKVVFYLAFLATRWLDEKPSNVIYSVQEPEILKALKQQPAELKRLDEYRDKYIRIPKDQNNFWRIYIIYTGHGSYFDLKRASKK